MKTNKILTILLILITLIFTFTTYRMSNTISYKSDIVDSLKYDLIACDSENQMLGSLLNQINKNDSQVIINAIDSLNKE